MLFHSIADVNNSRAFINRLRRRRFVRFQSLLAVVPRPVRILDVGGEPGFWRMMGLDALGQVDITLINVRQWEDVGPPFRGVWGDARDMRQFGDKEFDVAFSNSVIEHVGSREDQARMAAEVRRVGRRYFVQTPNRNFPLEPHFFLPGFQFLPLGVRAWLVQRFALGWYPRLPDSAQARREVEQIRLLSKREVQALFPDANVRPERVAGMTVSWIACGGWNE
jgi:hypothetical protein